jgi:tRNA G18 (ribose-2'-O)-methylase SpoU
MPRENTAFSNPLVKRVRNLREKRHRREEGLFLAEGLRILAEAEEAGVLPEYLFFAADSANHPIVRRLTATVEGRGGEAIQTSRDILHKLSGKDNPQVVLGVYRQFDTDLARIDRAASAIWLVGQAIRDPGNLGTMLRTGDAVGAGGLILIDDTVDPFSVEAVRASMGAMFTQRIAQTRWEAGTIGRAEPRGERALSCAPIRGADFSASRQRSTGAAGGLCGGLRFAREDPDAGQGRQPQCGGVVRGDGLRGIGSAARMTYIRHASEGWHLGRWQPRLS